MFNTLYAKLSATLVTLLVSIGVFYTLVSLSSASYYLQKTEQKLNLNLAENLVQDKNLVEQGKINQKALSSTFMEYMVINPSIEIYLLDTQGKILSFSAEPGKVKRRSVSLQPIFDFLNGKKLPLLGDDPRSHERQKIFSVTQVPSANNLEGYLYVVLQGEQYDNTERFIKESILWKQSGLALLGSLFIGLVIGLLLFRKLTYRLNKLSTNIDNFHQSDFSQLNDKIANHINGDEINKLENTFALMGNRIIAQMGELKKQDSLRRELVANVSHDLRTPIAILHGYLETLDLKSEQLNNEEKKHYIKQALKSSDQLNLLIAELFELAKLDATETEVMKEHFNLTELVHDVVQKFQLQATEHGIALNLNLTDSSVFCDAEIGLIARVIENLISNAIKFTPAKGEININIEKNEESIVITVTDTGVGMDEEDIQKIFHRFYQGKNNNNCSTSGGLGLAIAKRIVELHAGSLVVSSSSKGTIFTIKLPVFSTSKSKDDDKAN